MAYDHVVVDEFQDLNRAEQDLVDLLAARGALSIVGDEDQSIYRFRHANPDGIRDFHLAHAATHDETLDECRRCPASVVAMADSLIRHNHPVGTPTRLRPMTPQRTGAVHIVQWDDLPSEIDGLAAYVNHLVRARDVAPGDILILSPRKYIGYALRDAIAAYGIAAHSFYNEEALETEEAQLAFSLLTLAAAPDDRVAYRFWLGFGSSDWRRAQYATLSAAATTSGLSPRAQLAEVAAGRTKLAGVGTLVNRHADLDTSIAKLVGLTGDALIDAIFDPTAAWSEAIRTAWAAVGDPNADAATALDLLRTQVTHPEVPDEEAVRVMSLHKSKGLTSKVVIVTSCVQGLIPIRSLTTDPSERAEVLREQRRLFYVSLTRPTDTLVLSSCRGVKRALAYKLGMPVRGRSRTVSFIASKFLSELGPSAPASKTGADWAAAKYR